MENVKEINFLLLLRTEILMISVLDRKSTNQSAFIDRFVYGNRESETDGIYLCFSDTPMV